MFYRLHAYVSDTEYLGLMRLLAPEKYDAVTPERFGALLDLQNTICQNITLVLDDLDDYEGAVDEAQEQGIPPKNSDDCTGLFEEIVVVSVRDGCVWWPCEGRLR